MEVSVDEDINDVAVTRAVSSVDCNGINNDRDSTALPFLDVEETIVEGQNDKKESIASTSLSFTHYTSTYTVHTQPIPISVVEVCGCQCRPPYNEYYQSLAQYYWLQ